MTRPEGSVRRRPRGGRAGARRINRADSAGKKGPPPGRSKTTYAIDVRDQQAHLPVPAARIREIVRQTLAAEKLAAATISVALVDNRAIHDLNRRHLNHDYETDVLSFLFDAEPEFAPASHRPPRQGPAHRRRNRDQCRDGRPIGPAVRLEPRRGADPVPGPWIAPFVRVR